MVLKNLVENAVKFTAAGRVVTHIRQRGGGIEFEVSDTGAGIPKDQQTAIFEPFRRVHDPTATPGVGLGLHIVRRLVDLMKGTITVESEVDLGSCFRVWLPFDPSKSPEPQVESPRIAQAKAATSPIAY
jgi:signal transduction histidine kinase